jgi:hypothetical protein
LQAAPACSLDIFRVATASRRDLTIVAWHEVPGKHLQPAARVIFSIGIPEGLPHEGFPRDPFRRVRRDWFCYSQRGSRALQATPLRGCLTLIRKADVGCFAAVTA